MKELVAVFCPTTIWTLLYCILVELWKKKVRKNKKKEFLDFLLLNNISPILHLLVVSRLVTAPNDCYKEFYSKLSITLLL
uniref:Uncharacterized protein n=1 Tax=Octopus bimaculoides TaxID=37653 RepID=A0A0L8FL99_OCTBM